MSRVENSDRNTVEFFPGRFKTDFWVDGYLLSSISTMTIWLKLKIILVNVSEYP